ncbi:MAG: hypothetical protein IJ153_00090 [Clostridia bacterium]|nr:hypothetical protein [Clostridia bacterium]
MRKSWMGVLLALWMLGLAWGAGAEVRMTASPSTAAVGGIVDVNVETGEGATSVTYTLKNGNDIVFAGKEDAHFAVSFRPRQEGTYILEVEVHYAEGVDDLASVQVSVVGAAAEPQGPEIVYSQKDGWWKDKAYSKSELDNAGCAIFTLSHALQRMGWTGEDIAPENLAETYRKCYTKNGTANARLVYNASQVYGYTTNNNLLKDKAALREGLKNGDLYSFGIVIGHIALMAGVDESAGKVHIVDSAPSATFERIKKGKIYYLQDGEYIEAKDPGEIPGSRYYFETQFYGGLEYYLDLDYCARRGGRLIRPTWVYYQGAEEKIGATMVTLSSGESEITVNKKNQVVPTRELSWGDEGTPRLAVVNQKKAIRLLNAAGKRIATIPSCSVIPVLREEEEQVYVMYNGQRGYVNNEDVELFDPLAGEIVHGVISVKGNTSGRATVKLRYGPSEKERVVDNWKTGTKVTLIRKENDFWQVEAKGLRLWVQENYVTVE